MCQSWLKGRQIDKEQNIRKSTEFTTRKLFQIIEAEISRKLYPHLSKADILTYQYNMLHFFFLRKSYLMILEKLGSTSEKYIKPSGRIHLSEHFAKLLN